MACHLPLVMIATTVETIPTTPRSETSDQRPGPRPLDRILGSRSHVRVLRALVTKDPQENLGVREVARLAGVSHPRTAQVLRDLRSASFVIASRTRWGTVCDLNADHFLAPQLWTLFDDELHVFLEIEGYIRGEARKTRRQLRFKLEPGLEGDLELVLTPVRSFDSTDRRWFGEQEDGISERFGLDVRVREEDPNEWLLEL